MKYVHGFYTMSDQQSNLNLSQLSTTNDNFIESSLTSSAEQALAKYRDPSKIICWGCGAEDDHIYYDTRLRRVTCPQGHDPEVQKRAALVCEGFNRRAKRRRTARKSPRKAAPPNIKGILSALLKNDASELHTLLSPTKAATPRKSAMKQNRPTDGLVLMLLQVQPCLSSNNLPQLPIAIANSLPRIILLLGTSDSTFNPGIPAIIDTGAALNCTYAGYFMPIAKAYPELVKGITLCNDRYPPHRLVWSNQQGRQERTEICDQPSRHCRISSTLFDASRITHQCQIRRRK
jgi:hypothetical protein